MARRAAIDESTWRVPAAWWAKAVPFRGLTPPRAVDIAGGATQFADWVAEIAPRIENVVKTNATQRPDLVAEAIGYLDDSAPSARGAAIAAALLKSDHVTWRVGGAGLIVDGWLRHGVEFAVDAAVAAARFTTPDSRTLHEAPDLLNPYRYAALWTRLRTYLAGATEDEYILASDRLGQLRSVPCSPVSLLAASYLIPDNQEWLDAAIADPWLHPDKITGEPLLLLSACVTDRQQITRLAELHWADPVGRQYNERARRWEVSDRLYNVVTQVGCDSAQVLADMLDIDDIDTRTATTLAGLLAKFPTDEAFALLVERLERLPVAKAASTAAQHFPRRAMRQLVDADSNRLAVGELLRAHTRAFGEIASEFGIGRESTPTVPADQLPPVLRTAPRQKFPALPEWLSLTELPPILAREPDAALPESAVAIFCTMLAMSKPGLVPADVAEITRFATPATLSEFAWALFTEWQQANYPPNSQWVVHALGLLGDDRVALALRQLISTWSGKPGTARAVACLDVFTAIGTDLALGQLYRIFRENNSLRVRLAVQEKLGDVDDYYDTPF